MSHRLIHVYEFKVYKAKVYYAYHWREYQVKFYKNSKSLDPATTYFTDDKDDAMFTAEKEVTWMNMRDDIDNESLV